MKKFLFILLIFLIIVVPSYAGQWTKAKPAATDAKIDWPTDSQANNDAVDRLLSNYRERMKLVYSSTSAITVNSGEIVVSNATGTTRLFMNNTSSSSVTFSNLDTGSETSSTTYYVYAVATTTTDETATFVISASSSAPTGYTYYKRLGNFYNNSSSNIEQIKNDNDNTIIATGTIADNNTISLPSGYSQDECDWIVGVGSISASDTQARGLKTITFTASSSRVVSADIVTQNWVDGSTNYSFTGTANYAIICHR